MYISVRNRRNISQQHPPFGCNFHDIKVKGIPDYEGSRRDKQIFSGHKTVNQVLIYDRKKITPTLDLPLVVSK
ncbi:hypothetical protein AW118_06010 [Escherichia coli]|nr:hypothetical protein AW065_06195 [Escherichia coli]BDI35536.1 hypothetical protein EsCdI10290_01129 [Escherichia sp. 10290]BDI40554.1 hypothetical protein EsCd1HHP024_01144 [Escherichia sp. HH091_1A]BDI45463.1 integrase [Escherichia sp. HH154_1D]OTC23650.1 hypothetical protein AW073_07615 [Escherichia coli]